MMSDVQIVMKFELLPNELLIKLFEYLNALHIFYSFDQLNNRFNKLIRSIPLYLDSRHTHKLACDQFYKTMLSNQEIKKQIYSLHLSNKDSCYPIQLFLSIFSLNEFSHLRSLTLTHVSENNLEKLMTVIPLISHLSCFRLVDSMSGANEMVSVLPMSQLQTLMVSEFSQYLELIYEVSSITKLTISNCDEGELCQLLENASNLRYLKVGSVYEGGISMSDEDEHVTNSHAIRLKKLIMMFFEDDFFNLAMILKKTPNIKSLTISSYNDITMINAYQWEHLITSSLPCLNTFNFKFEWSPEDENDDIQEKFKEFQSDFWCKQHRWCMEYSLSEDSALIYTLPYMSDTYKLVLDTKRYCNPLVNNTNINCFNNVKDLIIHPDSITEKCQYYFSYVTSLTLGDPPLYFDNSLLKIKQIEYLKPIINLSNIKHLGITETCKLETPFVLIEILKEAQQISSLDISLDVLIALFNDDESCKYLNKMIKKLTICLYGTDLLKNIYELNQFCKVFSHIEQLICTTNQRDFILFFIKDLSKLSLINIYSNFFSFYDEIAWLEEEVQKLDIKIITEFYNGNSGNLTIWIIQDMY